MSGLAFRVIFVLKYLAFAAVRLWYRLLGPREGRFLPPRADQI